MRVRRPSEPWSGAEVGVAQAERLRDALLDELPDRAVSDLLQDQAQGDVVGVAVGPSFAGCEQRLLSGAHRQELLRRPKPWCPSLTQVGQHGVVGVVGQAAGMVQQHSNGDGRAVGHLAGQPPVHRVVQSQTSFGDQLEDQCGHERLRGAAHPELIAGLQIPTRLEVGEPDGELHDPAAVVDSYHGAGRALIEQLAGASPKLSGQINRRRRWSRRGSGWGAAGTRRHKHQCGYQRRRERPPRRSRPATAQATQASHLHHALALPLRRPPDQSRSSRHAEPSPGPARGDQRGVYPDRGPLRSRSNEIRRQPALSQNPSLEGALIGTVG